MSFQNKTAFESFELFVLLLSEKLIELPIFCRLHHEIWNVQPIIQKRHHDQR